MSRPTLDATALSLTTMPLPERTVTGVVYGHSPRLAAAPASPFVALPASIAGAGSTTATGGAGFGSCGGPSGAFCGPPHASARHRPSRRTTDESDFDDFGAE